jgi:hypothetical protein
MTHRLSLDSLNVCDAIASIAIGRANAKGKAFYPCMTLRTALREKKLE